MTDTLAPRPSSLPRSASADWWLGAADEVADTLRADVVAREAAREVPRAEIDLLRDAGLLTALQPAGHGGGGLRWSQALAAVRRIAEADTSIGQLLGYHYVVGRIPEWRGTPEQVERLSRGAVEGRWYWASPLNPREDTLRLVPSGDGYRLSGSKTFSSGAIVADRLVFVLPHEDRYRWVAIPGDRPGVSFDRSSWDHLGQRLTETNTVILEDVPVRRDELLARVLEPGAVAPSLTTPIMQSTFSSLYVGAARGALKEAAAYVREHGRTSPRAKIDGPPTDDPYVIERFGEWDAELRAAELLAAEAARAAEEVYERDRDHGDVTPRDRGEALATISAAKAVAVRTGLHVTSALFEVTGARSTGRQHGLDRHWRDIRTHSLHDPVVWNVHDVGRFALTGAIPEPDPIVNS